MPDISVQKETSNGLKQLVASNLNLSDAIAMLEQIQQDYRRHDVESYLSADGKTLTCATPDISSFKVTYRIVSPAAVTGQRADRAFRLHCFNRDCFAMAMLKHRDFQGYLVTGQHSGTHWIKWMLSHALAHHHGLEPPLYFDNASASSNDFIGHPKLPRRYPDLPRLATSHSRPPYAMQWSWLRHLLKLPPYALVVRDIRSVLISNYEKWRDRYAVPFSEYLKGDPWDNKYITDVWNYMHFLNRWGEIAGRYPAETLVLKYEDFQADPVAALARLSRHFGLNLTAADLEAGAAAGAKEVMAKHQDPAVAERALRPDGQGETRFSDEDLALLKGILERNLRHDFGYGYLDRPRGFQGHAPI